MDTYKEKARARDKKRYYYRKEHNLCIKCGKLPPIPGYVRCPVCETKQNYYSKRHYHNNKSTYKENLNRWRNQNKANNRCSHCGGPLDREGVTNCVNHRTNIQTPRRELTYAAAYKTIAKKP